MGCLGRRAQWWVGCEEYGHSRCQLTRALILNLESNYGIPILFDLCRPGMSQDMVVDTNAQASCNNVIKSTESFHSISPYRTHIAQ